MYSALFRKNPTVARANSLVDSIWAALKNTSRDGRLIDGKLVFESAPIAIPQGGACVASYASPQRYGVGIIDAEAAVAAILR
jgi:hypothetical protein